MPTNVIAMPNTLTAIGERIDAAYQHAQTGRQEWIDGSISLAAALIAAREQFPSDTAFGVWLRDNNHNHVTHQDRAALLKLGRNLELMRTVLNEKESMSYRLLWDVSRNRFTNAGNPVTNPNRSNTVSTGRGPWTNVIDDRLAGLLARGTSREQAAAILTQEFNRPFTKNMVINATRRLGLSQAQPVSSQPRQRRGERERAPSRGRHDTINISNRPSVAPMTREQVDPNWDRPNHEWVMRHGHVHVMTAVQKASQMFDTVSEELRAAARAIKDMQPQTSRSMMDDYWLRRLTNPKERTIARLTEALEYLRPRIAEAEAALAAAVAVVRSRQSS